MRRPDDDVFLRDGQGHFVGREPYRTHLKNTVERLQVRYMSNEKWPNASVVLHLEIPVQQSLSRKWPERRLQKL
jgi:hypothetical protein